MKHKLKPFKVVQASQRKCFICCHQCVSNNLNIKIKYQYIGIPMSLYLLEKFNILISPAWVICHQCLLNFEGQLTNRVLLQNKRLLPWNIKSNAAQKIITTLSCSNIMKNGLKLPNQAVGHLKLCTQYVLEPNTLTEAQKKKANRLLSTVVGLTKSQINKLMKEIFRLFGDKQTRKVFLTSCGKIFKLDKRKKKFNLKCILALLIKLRLGISNVKLEVLLGCFDIYKLYWHATALLEHFKEEHLVNTIQKLQKLKKYSIIRRLLKVHKTQDVICADGIRFETQKSRADHNKQKKNYDTKHEFNAVGFIGINVVDQGHFCGFYPETGTSTDGAHWDGRVMDFLILTDADGITRIVIPNTAPFEQNGTLVIMDRCLGNGCHMLLHGLIWYKFPCCSVLKTLSVIQANRSRLDATMHRWINECGFGKLRNYWSYFKHKVHYKLISVQGKWLNIAAAIMNFFEIGLVEMSKDRLDCLTFMDLKVTQEHMAPQEYNKHSGLLKQLRHDNSIYGDTINGKRIQYWFKCETLQDVLRYSTYWTKQKLFQLFDCNAKEISLISGGEFTLKQGWSYLVSSVNDMGLYVSNQSKHEKLLLIRNIKRKNTTKIGFKTRQDNPKQTANPTWHHVILSERDETTYIRDDVGTFPDRAKRMYWCCNCIAGTKTVNADSHVMCALLYVKHILYEMPIPTNIVNEKYWDSIIHVQGLQQTLNELTYESRHQLLTKWLKEFRKEFQTF